MSEGELTVDDYRLINCIATGNTSQIWEVVDPADSGHYAMKLLLPEAFMDPEQIKVIKHEGNVARQLDHPNFVKFQKMVVNKEHAYLVMEYFRAPNVKSQILGDLTNLQVRFRKLVEQTGLALAYLHEKGWVHKDIKPENILFNKGSELRLIDFSLSVRNATGFAKLLAGKPKVVQGTRTYIAPETIKREPSTPQTDIYSLGITLYEILTGSPPFKGSSPNDLLKKHLSAKPAPPSSYNANVTPEMDRFVLKMLSKKPADRHKTMHELMAEFRNVKIFKEDVQELADQKFAKSEQDRKDAAISLGVRLDSRSDHERTNDRAAAGAAAPPVKGGTAAAAPPSPAPVQPAPVQPAAPPRPAPPPAGARPGAPAAPVGAPGYAAPLPPGAPRPQPAPMQPAAAAGAAYGRPPAPQPQPGAPGMGMPHPGAPMPVGPGAPAPYPQQPWNYPPPPQQYPGQPPQGGPPRTPQPGVPQGVPQPPAPGAGRPPYQVRQPAGAPQPPQQPGQPIPQRPAPVGGQPAPGQPPARPAPRPAPPPPPQNEPEDIPLMDELPPVI